MRGLAGELRVPAVVAAAMLAALVLSACGGSSSQPAIGADREAEPLGEVRVGSVAPLAQCSDWRRGSRAERLATIDDVRAQINLQDNTVATPELSDEQAYEVLDGMCENDFASGFRLYKVYARAAAFQSLGD